jgi:maltose O-acetyltransferase
MIPPGLWKLPGRRELLYGATERVFSRLPPFTAHRVLALALRASGVRMGHASVFWGAPTLTGSGPFCSRLSIGAHCGFNVDCYFELEAPVTIGDHVSVGHDVMFLTRKHTSSSPTRRAAAPTGAAIEVGDGAWLGARCVILPGVKIGAGAVIGASVVVEKDVPADIMLAGNRRISIAKWR